MLRRAAKPRELRSSDEIRLWLGVHDLSRIECTVGVPLPIAGERKYQVEFSVEIPSNTFSAHDVWEHLQIHTRLQSPSEEGTIEIERGDLEELRRDALGIAHRLKMLRNRIERASADAVTERSPEALARALDEHVGSAVAMVHEVRRQLSAPGRVSNEVVREGRLADELLSHQLIEFFAACQRALDEAPSGAGETAMAAQRRRMPQVLDEELQYRREHAWVTPRADARDQLSAFIDRASRLKKHFQDVLFLEATAYFVDSRVRYYVMVVAAALAAIVFLTLTALPIGPGARASVGVGTFLAIFAAGYALRDVIKEYARSWITRHLMQLYGQRVVTLRLPARLDPTRKVVCQTRETFDIESESADGNPTDVIGRPRRIMRLHFRMRAELQGASALERAHIDSVKHIFRYDLSPIFSRLDDAVKPVPVVELDGDERRVRFCDAPREYRFPGRVAFSDGTMTSARDVVIIVTKRGIERIEAPPKPAAVVP